MRRIRKAPVEFLSLCKRGANRVGTLLKSSDSSLSMLVKESPQFEEKGELLFVGYVPEFRDDQGDIADADVVKDMAYDWMRRGAKLDLRHDGKPLSKEQAYVAENFIIQKADPRFEGWKDYDGKPVDVTNAWGGVIKIEDPSLRAKYRSKEWDGVSFGTPEGEDAELQLNKTDDRMIAAMHSLVKKLGKKDDDMTTEELTLALKPIHEALAKLTKAPEEKPAPKPVAAFNEEPSAFEGDMSKAEDVEKHLQKVTAARLAKTVDWNDPKAVENHLASLKKNAPKPKAPAEEVDESAELKKARKDLALAQSRLAKAEKASAQDPGDEDEEDIECQSLTKEQRSQVKLGERLAENINRSRGYADKK